MACHEISSTQNFMNFKLIFNDDRSARREQVCPQGAANLTLLRATVHGNSGISL